MMRTRNVLIALAGIALVSGCKQQQAAEPEIDITASESAPKTVSLPVVDPPLDRQALLLAASQAASNYALGRADAEAQKQLDGKRFAMRLRFGCDGPAPKSASEPRSWSFDERRRVLSFRVMLDVEPDRVPAAVPSEASVEAVEGFWIERPWMLQAGCPRAPAQPSEAPAASAAPAASSKGRAATPAESPRPEAEMPGASRQVGLAQFFLDTDARTHRRENRAYETTKVLSAGAEPSKEGYDLVIAGRLRQLTDGRVIACGAAGPGVSPSCIVSIVIDNVSIEIPGGGETVATWNGA